MNKNMMLALIAITLGCAGFAASYATWSLSHLSTGHIIVTTPNPQGNFTIPASFDFPTTEKGDTSTITVHVTSTLDQTVTLTASGGLSPITVTSNTVTLPAEGEADITLTAHVGDDAEAGGHPIPVTFTVTQG